MNKRLAIFGSFLLAILMACTTVPVTSIPTLMKIDPVSTDISSARIIIKYPNTISYKKENIGIFANYTHNGKAH